MAALAVTLPCQANGATFLTLNFCAVRAGGDNDRASFRVVRRLPDGSGSYVLPGEPDAVLPAQQDMRSWTFVDHAVPSTGNFVYQVQIKPLVGGGTFFEMVLSAIHFKR